MGLVWTPLEIAKARFGLGRAEPGNPARTCAATLHPRYSPEAKSPGNSRLKTVNWKARKDWESLGLGCGEITILPLASHTLKMINMNVIDSIPKFILASFLEIADSGLISVIVEFAGPS